MKTNPEDSIRHNVSIRKGDQVRVMTGRDKGKEGRVLSVDPYKRTVTVEHAAMIKRHTRPNPSKNIKGGIVEREGALAISNVLVICPGCGKPTRVGHKPLPEGSKPKRIRTCTRRLRERYRNDVIPALMKRFGYKNPMAVPKLAKVVVNIGLGEASQNVKLLDVAALELGQITGQKPIITRAKKSIANFKIRKGMPIGCCVTLRGDRMYEFMDRLCNVVLPRVRDFKGLPTNAFDGRGNYTLGLRDQLVFPEIDYTRVDKIKGMNITLTTTARNDEEGRELLKLLGVPLRV